MLKRKKIFLSSLGHTRRFPIPVEISGSSDIDDKCPLCYIHEQNGTTDSPEYLRHRAVAGAARAVHQHACAETDPRVLTFVADLGSVKPFPKCKLDFAYYKMRANLYPLTIHEFPDRIATFLHWTEFEGGRDANCCISALWKYLRGVLETRDIDKVNAFFDNCSGQNKSSYNA